MRKILIASIFVPAFCAFSFGQNSNCPKISVTGPAGVVQPDENIEFTANVSGIDPNKVGYKWTVTEGMIVAGQGTPKIPVWTKGLYDNAIKATAEFLNLPEGCANSESETIIIACRCLAELVDEFNISAKFENKSLDATIIQLKNKPDSIIYIIIDPSEKTTEKKIRARRKQIVKYLLEKNISIDRIVTVRSEMGSDRIQFFIVPPSAEPPTP